jgi:hypothetical protein
MTQKRPLVRFAFSPPQDSGQLDLTNPATFLSQRGQFWERTAAQKSTTQRIPAKKAAKDRVYVGYGESGRKRPRPPYAPGLLPADL